MVKPSLDDDEVECVGKIITHAYITYGVFPLQLCSSSLKYFILGEVDDEDIKSSFLNFLPQNECDLLRKFKESEIPTPAIMDIFSDYAIFSRPSKENIDQLIVKAGKIALIRNPCFSMQQLIKGMGNFWKKLTKEHFDSIFNLTVPNATNIIDSLVALENTKQEGRILTWFHRYIRSCSQIELARLIRFITGSPLLIPNAKIKIEFVDQQISLRPNSQTCFKILMLPRQYSSLSNMTENLNFYIGNQSAWCVHDLPE